MLRLTRDAFHSILNQCDMQTIRKMALVCRELNQQVISYKKGVRYQHLSALGLFEGKYKRYVLRNASGDYCHRSLYQQFDELKAERCDYEKKYVEAYLYGASTYMELQSFHSKDCYKCHRVDLFTKDFERRGILEFKLDELLQYLLAYEPADNDLPVSTELSIYIKHSLASMVAFYAMLTAIQKGTVGHYSFKHRPYTFFSGAPRHLSNYKVLIEKDYKSDQLSLMVVFDGNNHQMVNNIHRVALPLNDIEANFKMIDPEFDEECRTKGRQLLYELGK